MKRGTESDTMGNGPALGGGVDPFVVGSGVPGLYSGRGTPTKLRF